MDEVTSPSPSSWPRHSHGSFEDTRQDAVHANAWERKKTKWDRPWDPQQPGCKMIPKWLISIDDSLDGKPTTDLDVAPGIVPIGVSKIIEACLPT